MELAEGVPRAAAVESGTWRDVVALAKPRLSALVWVTSGVGVALAPGRLGAARAALVMSATLGAVAAANALNHVDERAWDARMHRTRGRPLASGRLAPAPVTCGALALAALSLGTLFVAANPATALEGLVALATYVWIYTPMKRRSAWAVVVGAVPGALPPLMGWTAAAGVASAGGWALFALLFAWQLPHFLAIAVSLAEDYARGGMRVVPLVLGVRATQAATVAAAVLVAAVALALPAVGLGGRAFWPLAAALGALFVVACAAGQARPEAWARRVFLASILYLSFILTALLAGRPEA